MVLKNNRPLIDQGKDKKYKKNVTLQGSVRFCLCNGSVLTGSELFSFRTFSNSRPRFSSFSGGLLEKVKKK